MLFSSHLFIFVFLPIAVVGFRASRNSGYSDLWLIAVSIVFYAFAGAAATIVVLGSAVANHFISIGLTRVKKPQLRTLALAAAIVSNLLLLGYFKYFPLMLQSLAASLQLDISMQNVSLPLGISFFTFQQIAYLIDIQSKQAPVPTFRNYLLFVTFFPQASSGPINYWHETIPQYQRLGRHSGTLNDLSVGLTIFAFGLFKKTVFANSLGQFVDPVFGDPGRPITFVDAWTAAICYALQIYFDFSGYTDMAIGIGRMFGLRLPINFNSPFKACNLVDFWRSWHMTMTRFFTDYVYSPLALHWTRQSIMRRDSRAAQFLIGVALPTVIAFVLIGWWHGAKWTLILFGAIHAIGLITNQAWRQLKWPSPPRIVGWAVTFGFFVTTVVLFRASTLDQAFEIYQIMAGKHFATFGAIVSELRDAWRYPASQGDLGIPLLSLVSKLTHAPQLLIYLIALVFICAMTPNTMEIMSRYRPALSTAYRGYAGFIQWRMALGWSVAIAAMLTFAIINISHVEPFIYVQF